MQTHLSPRTLRNIESEDEVTALFSTQVARKAILFIHGFSGNAIETWANFPTMLPGNKRFADRDLYFYGFDGLWADLNASAAMFREFLELLLGNPKDVVNRNLHIDCHRPEGFDYDEMLIVAHSLGAVVARRALLDATGDHQPWAPRIRLFLFAPAHNGAPAAELALEAAANIPFLQKLVPNAVEFVSPLIRQLQPESKELKQLLADTLAARENNANPHVRAKRVFLAQYEKIIAGHRFADDPSPHPVRGANHITACKPRPDFRTPLELLEKYLEPSTDKP